MPGSLQYLEDAFVSVGWFIPPYATMQWLHHVAAQIKAATGSFIQPQLEAALASLYESEGLAAMSLLRYPVVPFVQDFSITIREAIEAHFLKLDHVAVGGLVPVVEGAGQRIATDWQLPWEGAGKTLIKLAVACKDNAINKQIGAPQEISSMMDSFVAFLSGSLYVQSYNYPFDDGTNRHGITHGAFADKDYGSALNFYKVIAAIDFLSFVAGFRAPISMFAPSPTDATRTYAEYLRALSQIAINRP